MMVLILKKTNKQKPQTPQYKVGKNPKIKKGREYSVISKQRKYVVTFLFLFMVLPV